MLSQNDISNQSCENLSNPADQIPYRERINGFTGFLGDGLVLPQQGTSVSNRMFTEAWNLLIQMEMLNNLKTLQITA